MLTAAAYSSVATHDFLQFDDADYVTENGAVRAGLTLSGLRWAFTSSYAGNWHPLTWISHMTDVQIFGMDPGWHHLSNLLLHLLTTLVLFRLFVRMTSAVWPSAFVAAMFALHPLHVESVAWIAERKDVLSTFWWTVAVTAYVEHRQKGGMWRYVALLASFALALLSKPMVITLPFVLLLLDVWPLRRWQGAGGGHERIASLIREKVPLFLMAAAVAAATFYAQRQAGAVQSLDAFPLALRLANAPVAYVQYLLSTVWPANLAALYPYPDAIPLWKSLGALAILVAITIAVVRAFRAQPWLAVGWFWFLGTTVPVLGLVQAGAQPYADRFMYVPGIGLFIMAAWAAADAAARRPVWARRFVAIGVALTIAATVVTARTVPHWRNDVTLWEQAVSATSNNYRAHTNLGFALAEQGPGARSRAMAEYREALRLNPSYAQAHNYLGLILADIGDHDAAIAEFQAAIKLRPRFVEPRNNLGLTLAAAGRMPEAITVFAEILQIAPGFVPARRNLGIAYAQQADFARAIETLQETVRQDPTSAESHASLAQAMSDVGRKTEALTHFSEAIRLGGDPALIQYSWGRTLLDLGDTAGAAEHFGASVAANPSNPVVLHYYGRTLAANGKLVEAIGALQRAAQLDPSNPDYFHDLGAALARRGMIKEAVAAMQAALQINPEHAEAREALRMLTGK